MRPIPAGRDQPQYKPAKPPGGRPILSPGEKFLKFFGPEGNKSPLLRIYSIGGTPAHVVWQFGRFDESRLVRLFASRNAFDG